MDLISIRRRLLRDPVLPPMYRRVEYLQSSGTQYINTGLTYVYGYKVHIESLDYPIPYDNVGYLGWWNGASQNNVQSYSASTPKTFIVTRGTNNETYTIGTVLNFEITVDGTSIFANGHSYTGNAVSPDIRVPFMLFGYNRSTGVVNCAGSCRIRYAKFFDANHALVRNFIPCVRSADGKPGMYDTVTKSFYVNQGTGEFIVP